MGFGKQSPSVREPAAYHILRVRRHGTSDPASVDTRLIRRIHTFSAAGMASADAAPDSAQAGCGFVGSGVRVYKGRYAFAFRDERQIEIETLRVRSCIVVTFANLDRRIVGLLRFDGAGSDGALLSEFFGAAARRTRDGDRIKLEVRGGGSAEGEAPSATTLRRRDAVRAIDDMIRRTSALLPDLRVSSDCASLVRWMDGSIFDLRIESWNGKVSILTGNPES